MGAGFTRPLKEFASRRQRRLLLLGLDGAGKSAIACAARAAAAARRGGSGAASAQVSAASPAAAGARAGGGGDGGDGAELSVETFRLRGLTLQLWDVSGASARRPLWRHFFTGTQGVVFVVDASDGARMALAAAELRAAAADEQLAGAAFVVAVTHGDAPGAAPLADVGAALAVEAACAGHAWALLPVNGATGAGLDAVWDFLCEKTRRL
jgi:hypothetical protein